MKQIFIVILKCHWIIFDSIVYLRTLSVQDVSSFVSHITAALPRLCAMSLRYLYTARIALPSRWVRQLTCILMRILHLVSVCCSSLYDLRR